MNLLEEKEVEVRSMWDDSVNDRSENHVLRNDAQENFSQTLKRFQCGIKENEELFAILRQDGRQSRLKGWCGRS